MVLARVGLVLQKISMGSFQAVIFVIFGPYSVCIWAAFGQFEAQKIQFLNSKYNLLKNSKVVNNLGKSLHFSKSW